MRGYDRPGEEETPTLRDLRQDEAFVVFATQDSGCVSYGIQAGSDRWFVKQARTDDARSSLRRAIHLHERVEHSAIVPVSRTFDTPELTLVYEWKHGTVLNHATVDGSDRSGLKRFQTLPVPEVQAALATILHAHRAISGAGIIAVDLYDGCFLYDFDTSTMWLIDLDEYRRGPFTLEADRLPGSLRYMAPEELTKGSVIDDRTSVHLLGRVLHHLLDSDTGWRGSSAQATVVERATHPDPALRWATVEALAEAWARP